MRYDEGQCLLIKVDWFDTIAVAIKSLLLHGGKETRY